MPQNFLFEFIQIAMGVRNPLPFVATDEDWLRIYAFCRQQALLGIGFVAVEKLYGQGIRCPESLKMQWLANVLQIERRNELLNSRSVALVGQCRRDGLQCCILKGQGNLLNYPRELRGRRNPGDIDVWVCTEDACTSDAVQEGKSVGRQVKGQAVRYGKMQCNLFGIKGKPIVRYHHVTIQFMGDTSVEMHFRAGFCNSPLRNWRMQRWLGERTGVCMENVTPMKFAVPTASFNVVYQMTHIFSHFLASGIGLRQFMDYYYVLKRWHGASVGRVDSLLPGEAWAEEVGTDALTREEVMDALESFGMAKFASAVMWVLHEVFAMSPCYYICEPDGKRGRELLDEIMRTGNFGKYDRHGRRGNNCGMVGHGTWKLKRAMRLMASYPEEVLWKPFFRIWCLGWIVAYRFLCVNYAIRNGCNSHNLTDSCHLQGRKP